MTVMDPRPWSPASPHIGPDDEDLAMLDPTGDSEVDLGSAVLAVHRVGGAAAEAVARAPLPDEYRLIDALGRAREELAPRAVEAVSKCLERDDVYPDLLLRDLFDAGEQAAVTVYRACVSKGVAPPLAVQRAGLVYGVPPSDLGRYLAVAADPRAHPIAIADAADRAVARWASGVVREELDSRPVAKRAPAESLAQYAQTSFGREHPKDPRGRFTDVMERGSAPTPAQVSGRPVGFLARLRRDGGAGEQAAPEVDGVAVEAPPAAPVQQRVQRQQRTQRVQRSQAAVTTPAALKGGLKASLRSRLRGEFGSRLQSRLVAQRNKTGDVEPLQAVSYDDEGAIGRQFNHRLDKLLAWSMSIEQANEIFQGAPGAGTYDKPKHVKMGQLQQVLAEPYEWGDQHHDQMRSIAELAAGDQRPRFIHLSADELEANGISVWGQSETDVESRVKDYARTAGYYSQLSRDEDGTYNPILQANMGLAPSADPGTGDWYLVLNPEPVVYGHPEGAPLPAAAEFVVFDDSGNTARVNVEGTDRQLYYEMDPTQHWVIHEPRTLWKQTGESSGYWVDRYSVEPVDDIWSGGKAVTVAERWRTEPRNDRGEWTKGGFLARVAPTKTATREVVTSVPTPIVVPRAQRRQRVQRKTQPTSAIAAQTKATLRLDVSTKLSGPMLRAFHTGLTQDSYEVIDTSVPAWDDRKRYVVLSADDWDHLLRQTSYRGFRNEVVPRVPLTSAARANFLGRMRDAVDGTDADSEVRLHVENEIMEKHKDDRREITSMRFRIPEGDEHAGVKWHEAGRRISNMMAVDHSVQSVRIDPGAVLGDYRVMVNRRPVSDVVVVLLPDDIDPDKPITLVSAGRARQSALNRNIDRYADEALHIDAPVQMFRVTQGVRQVWHARQDEQ